MMASAARELEARTGEPAPEVVGGGSAISREAIKENGNAKAGGVNAARILHKLSGNKFHASETLIGSSLI